MKSFRQHIRKFYDRVSAFQHKITSKRNGNILNKLITALTVLLILFFFYLAFIYNDFIYGIIGFGFVLLSCAFLFGDTIFGAKRLKLPFKLIRQLVYKHKTQEIIKTAFVKELKRNLLLYVSLVIAFFVIQTVVSSYFIFSSFPYSESVFGLWVLQAYFTILAQNLKTSWAYIIIPAICIYLVGLILFFITNKKRKSARHIRNFVLYSVVIIFSFVPVYFISNGASLLFSKIWATQEVRIMSSQLSNENSLSKLGIISDTQQIKRNLQDINKSPTIISSDNNPTCKILLYLVDRKKRSFFYKKYLFFKACSSSKIVVNIKSNILLLPDNSLIINKIDKDALNTISPTLSYLMVKSYFKPKLIKTYPEIEILGRQEYLKYRDDEINKQLAKIDGFIADAKSTMNYYANNITKDKQMITYNQNGLDEAVKNKDSSYNTCMSAGYSGFFTGIFYRYYSDSYCEALRAQANRTAAAFQKNISDWQAQLSQDQYSYSSYKKIYDYLSNYRGLVETQKDQTIRELGIFLPPSTIKLVLENTSESSIADFLATAVHEYLHYSSYVSDERQLPNLFDEGLTEYFSRKIIMDQVKTKTNIGYPLLVKILERIAKDIPRQTLEDIYFNKDENTLISALNNKYGDNFYKDSKYYFDVIVYLDDTEALMVANDIIYRIGGEQLTIDDMYSTESSFSGTISQ